MLRAMVADAREAGRASREGARAAAAGEDAGVRVMSSAEFLAAHADVARTRTLSGYNPMLQDYPNTRVLCAELPPWAGAPAS